MLRTLVLLCSLSFIAGATALAAPTPTPIPGGANAVNAVAGKLGETVFNGVLRLQLVELRDATPDEIGNRGSTDPGKKAMTMTVLLRNGTSRDFIDLVRYSLADKDDIAYDLGDNVVTPNPPHILQAAALRQKALFIVDKDYAPTKLIVRCATCSPSLHFRAFRIAL